MLLSGRISIGEMSFSPTRQLSLVELWSSSRVSYWWPPIRWTLRGNTSQVGSLEYCVFGVDVIRLGRNPRTDPRSAYGRYLRTDFDQYNDPFSLRIVSRRNTYFTSSRITTRYTPPIGFKNGLKGGLISTCSSGLEIQLNESDWKCVG